MRKIESLFKPKKIAIIGATDRPSSVGLGLVNNLSQGKRKLFFVNPNLEKVKGKKTYPSILDLKEKIDLAVVAVPAPVVSSVVRECGRQGVKNIIVVSAGFAEIGKEGRKRQAELAKIAQEYKLNLVGPNCLGIIRPAACLNASFAPAMPPKGKIAFVSQSGALLDSVIDQSLTKNYGFSALISYGNEADLSLEDYLIFLEKDKQTKVILLYLEGVKDGRRFLEVAKKITPQKPIVVLKAGRTSSGRKAVASHTASLAGADEVYRAAFKQAGVIVADSLEEMLAVAKGLAWQPSFHSKLAIVTNGGGMGVLATDYAQEEKVALASLSRESVKRLKLSFPSTISLTNPLDIVGDASAERYRLALEAVLSQKNVGGVIVIQTIQTVTEVMKNAKVIIESHRRFSQKPMVSVCLKGRLSQKGIAYLEKHRLPNYSDPWLAIKAIKALRKSPFS